MWLRFLSLYISSPLERGVVPTSIGDNFEIVVFRDCYECNERGELGTRQVDMSWVKIDNNQDRA